MSEEALAGWGYQRPRQSGAQFAYSDQAIEAVLTLKEVFHLSNLEAEGLVQSVFALMQVNLAVPDHSTLSRRGRTVQIRLPKRARGPLHIVMDSSGLKVYGEGEWKVRQHGWSKRRTWRKMHLSVDVESGEVQAVMLSTAGVSDSEMVEPMLAQIEEPIERVAADGAYDKRSVYANLHARAPDAEIVIPPRHNARIWQHGNTHAPPHPRDEALRFIRGPLVLGEPEPLRLELLRRVDAAERLVPQLDRGLDLADVFGPHSFGRLSRLPEPLRQVRDADEREASRKAKEALRSIR